MIVERILRGRLDGGNLAKLAALENPALDELIVDAILRFQPNSVFISTGLPKDLHYVRTQAVRRGEEKPLITPGHTIHFDGPEDQGRDPANTKFLASQNAGTLDPALNCIDEIEGLEEINQIMDGTMHGREMIVSFYSLGPLGTEFAMPAVQITDSFYVCHSEDILYRSGYELFKREAGKAAFFGFLHSTGPLKHGVSRDVDHRRVFIDLDRAFVYSTNTQYAGNTVAAKKLAHRLAIRKSAREGWLSEHLLIAGVPGYEDGGCTYIAGAFPSWCGKTSTSMLFNVVGDDLAHIRKKDGKVYAANVEKGMFGVIKDVNPEDDPYIYHVLIKPGEIIFSNVLDGDGRPYWQGMGNVAFPLRGDNHCGTWWKGKKDKKGRSISVSHDNARFSIALEEIENFDRAQVVELEGIVYGGRSSRRPVPVSQSYGWVHGVFYGASIESEPTAATVGASTAKATINPMANKEFLSIPIGRYLENHVQFGRDLKTPPSVFYVNYFLTDDDGRFMNTKMDKKVWIRWIERRLRGKMGAYATPTGFIPKYEDLAALFERELQTRYARDQYELQFRTVVPELLDKLEVVERFYRNKVEGAPEAVLNMIKIQRNLLLEVRKRHGDVVSPFKFDDYGVPAELTKPF